MEKENKKENEEKNEIKEKLNNSVPNKKKKNKLLILLKIVFFPIYLIFLLFKGVFKLFIKILVLPIKLMKFIYKAIIKLGKFILKHKKGTIIFCISILIIAITIYKINQFFSNYNKIYIASKEIINSSEHIYTVDNKITNLKAKINTLNSIENTQIKIYAGNLNLYENNYGNKKSWKIEIDKLIVGTNIIEINVNFKNGKQITNTLYLYNTNEENLGDLDIKDTDNDGLQNYQEDIIGTDKNNIDTDSDGISDYDEQYYILTDPLNKDTDGNSILDSNEDFDKDGLSNIEELQYKTNAYIVDSDSDELTDYDEVKKYNTNPNQEDTDNDGINDNIELNKGLNPNEENKTIKTSKVSEDRRFYVELDNVSGQQAASLNVKERENAIISKDYEAYIAGPYDINIDGQIQNAVIKFSFDASKLKDNAKPTIYYFNYKTKEIEELNTNVTGNVATATISHFSEYILLDKNIIDNKLKNAPNVDGSNVKKESLMTDEYIIICFPIVTYFGVPIYIYKVDNSLVGYQNTETSFSLASGDSSNVRINIVFKKVSKFGAKIVDKLFSWFEKKLISTYKDAVGDTTNYNDFKKYVFLYKHIYQASDLEGFLGTDEEIASDSAIAEKEKDSNNDGISDYFTKLICNGQLTTKNGTNPFGTLSYSDIQRSKDIDKDKLKNGEEIEIIEENGKYFIVEHSSPILADTDSDGVNDKYDASPLEKFDDRFMSVKSLGYIPSTPSEDKFESESNKVYNTKKGDYGTSLKRAHLLVSTFGKMPAALSLGHFLENTGTTYSFNSNKWGLLETYRGKEHLAKNTNDLMNVVEETVKNNQSLYFATNKELTGTNFSSHFEDLANIGWWYAVGSTRATMTAKATNIDDKNYKMTLYYNIVDFYDWNEKGTVLNGGFGGLVSDAEMYKLHTFGIAKQYRINIQYKMEITWQKGDRYYLNKIYLYKTPSSMNVKNIN